MVVALVAVAGFVFGGLSDFNVEVVVHCCNGEALTFFISAVLLYRCHDVFRLQATLVAPYLHDVGQTQAARCVGQHAGWSGGGVPSKRADRFGNVQR